MKSWIIYIICDYGDELGSWGEEALKRLRGWGAELGMRSQTSS